MSRNHDNRLYEVLIDTLGSSVFKDKSVLDVGCGGQYADSKIVREMGAFITAMDTVKKCETPDGIRFVQSDFTAWNADVPVDIVYMSNSAQFMPVESVFKKIEEINPEIIAVRTMFDYPIPNWEPPVLQKLYFTTEEDWKTRFESRGYETMLAIKYEKDANDMRGDRRHFHVVEYIGRKKA